MRETVASFVGYPKDAVSRKLLKADILFGSDAVNITDEILKELQE